MARKSEVVDRSATSCSRGCSRSAGARSTRSSAPSARAIPVEAPDVRDTEEQSVDDFVQEVDFALMQMKSETLEKIDEAMQRLEDGTYGRCHRVRRRDRRGPPAGPALRRPVPRLPGGGREHVRAQREAKAFERLQRELANVTLRAGARD